MNIRVRLELRKLTMNLLHGGPEVMVSEGYRQRGIRQDTEDQGPNRGEGFLDLSKPVHG